MRSVVASKILLYQVGRVIAPLLFTCLYYYGAAPFLVGEDMEQGEQPAEAEEEAQVGVQLVHPLLIGRKSVVWLGSSHFVCHLQSQGC